MLAVFANERDNFPRLDIRELANVQHKLIHGNRSNLGHELPSHEHLQAIRQLAGDSIRIADADNGKAHLTMRNESVAVAHSGAGRNRFDLGNSRFNLKNRLEVERRLEVRSGVESVQS